MSKIRANRIGPFSAGQVTVEGSGVYLPILTTAQRNAIPTPGDGLLIYNSDTHAFEHYNSALSAWESADGIQSLNGLNAKIQLLANGSAGTTPNWVSSGITHTLNIPLAKNANVAAGLISNQDWTMFAESATMGLMEGGGIHSPLGLTAVLQDGFGFLEQEPEIFYRFDWITQTLTFPANQSSYLYIDDTGDFVFSPTYPDTHLVILIGRVVTDASNVIFIDNSPLDAEHSSNLLEEFHRKALGPVYANGSAVTESGTRNLTVTSGLYFLSGTKFQPVGGAGVSWKAFSQDGVGGFTYSPQNVVDNAQYDDGSGTLASLTAGYYAKHALYLVGDGTEETYMLVYSQAEYSALALAQQGDLPTPPAYFIDGVVLIASLIVQQGVSSISEIRDERPVVGFKASGISATTYHSGLLGLADGDDHPQYWRNDGTHVATGDFNLGTKNITNLGTANGVVVEAHASRHNPGGADALATAAPIAQTPDNANAEGVATSLSRSDHVHNIPTAVAVGINANSTNTQGAAATFSRSNHTHAIATGAPSTQTPNQANAIGTSANIARADHIHNIPTAAPINQIPDQANADGAAATFSKSDHVHNIPAAAPITTLTPATTNAKGVAATFSLSDHTHAIATSLVADITSVQAGAAASAGVVDKYARGDHKHNISTAAVVSQTPDQANAEGTSASVARADHIHNIPAAIVTTIGTVNAKGSAASFSLSDHVHAHGAQTDPTLHALATVSAHGFMSSTDKSKLDGISGTRIFKSGLITAGTFTGNPKKATVTFSVAFPNTNYSIAITGADGRTWTYESKLAGSFVINANANTALTGEVSWTAISTGESVE